MRSITFSKSVRVATGFLLKMANEEKFAQNLPAWKNFTFFHKIEPGPVSQTGTEWANAQEWKILKRTIKYYGYKNTLLAIVELEGTEGKNGDGSKLNFWRVSELRYLAATHFWHSKFILEEESPLQ